MTNYLVTGGTGFLGSNLVKGLIKDNKKVTVFDNNFRGDLKNISHLNNLNFIQGDIRNINELSKAMKDIDIVYHLAFINGTSNFYQKPGLVLDVGIKGMINLIDLIPNSNVKKIVLASSSEVYQTPINIPTSEIVECKIPDVMNPRYSYGGTKIINELMLLHHHKLKDVKKTIFRPHNLYGPNMGWEHAIPQLIKKIFKSSNKFKSKTCHIEIQGTGEETRSYCFIDDAIEALNIIENSTHNNEIYNIGNNDEISILNLIKNFEDILKIKISTSSVNLSEGSTFRRCPDISKLIKLGFKNSFTLNDGLLETINWYKKYLSSNYG